jgi:uncharacterized protein YqhQ
MSEETPNPTNVGGQAVIEGVMMRAPGSLSIVCRRRDGSLVVRERTIEPPKSGLWTLPLFRGAHTLVSSLRIGSQSLRWSAEIMEADLLAEEREQAKSGAKATGAAPPSTLSMIALLVAGMLTSTGDEVGGAPADDKKGGGAFMILPILFAVGLFIALPQLAAEGANSWLGLGLEVTSPGFQVITGAAKLSIIVGYMALIRLMPDVRRVFQYHGAEHKAISTYEARKPLLLEHARPTSALHARCGTTFIIMVAFVSVVLFSAVGAFLPPLPGPRIAQSIGFFAMKLPLLPVMAGITYELQRFFAKYCTTGPLQVLLWPGFLVQKITTAEPDDAQLEVALASLRAALARATTKLATEPEDRSFASYDNLVDDPSYRAPAEVAVAEPATA